MKLIGVLASLRTNFPGARHRSQSEGIEPFLPKE